MSRSLKILTGALVLIVAGACSSSKTNTQATGTPPEDSGPTVPKCTDPSAPLVGTSATGAAGFTVKVLDAAPASPSQSHVNQWTLVVTGPDGKPVDGLAIDANCGMTIHSHNCGGTGPKLKGTGNGQYDMSSIIFTMGGDWYITFSLFDADGGVMDSPTITFCVP